MNEPRYFVGLEIERDRNKRTVKIHQASYIEKLIDKFRLKDAKIVSVPLNPTVKYSSNMCPKLNEEKIETLSKPYNEMLGSLYEKLWQIVAICGKSNSSGYCLCSKSVESIQGKSREATLRRSKTNSLFKRDD